MKILKTFLIANTAFSGLLFLFCGLAAIGGSHYTVVLSMVFLTNGCWGLIAYRTMRKLPAVVRTTPAKPTPAKQLDATIVKSLIKKGFRPELIEDLFRSGRMTVVG